MTNAARLASLTLWLALFACVGCSRLPDYAAPQGRVVDPTSPDQSDVIGYRTLERSDFRGEHPPPGFAPYAARIGAATCAHIVSTPDTQVMIRSEASPGGGTVYRATTAHLAFYSEMDRDCSWWNPDETGFPQAYILQHEQIHFALFELEARRLTAQADEIGERMNSTGDTAEKAASRAQDRLNDELRKRIRSILERSRDFDEQTSMGHRPEAQRKWWERVQAELSSTSGAR